jgi:hypothetical protein
MKFEQGVNPNIRRVLVDANELQCNVRAMPYSAYIGTVDVKSWRVQLWYPAATLPRGYKKAAEVKLREARDILRKEFGAELSIEDRHNRFVNRNGATWRKNKERSSKWHLDSRDWISTGQSWCGEETGRMAYAMSSPLLAFASHGSKLCKRCLAALSKDGAE